jgi:hypothetical protein
LFFNEMGGLGAIRMPSIAFEQALAHVQALSPAEKLRLVATVSEELSALFAEPGEADGADEERPTDTMRAPPVAPVIEGPLSDGRVMRPTLRAGIPENEELERLARFGDLRELESLCTLWDFDDDVLQRVADDLLTAHASVEEYENARKVSAFLGEHMRMRAPRV